MRHRDTKGNKKPGHTWLKVLAVASGMALIALKRPKTEAAPSTPAPDGLAEERRFRRMVIHGWIVVCAIAVLFVLYGFFAFFVVGDKGPPDWDYGSIEDIPGQSVYSTYPYRGRVPQPEPQHVNERPSSAATREMPHEKNRSPDPKTPADKERGR